MSNDFSPNMGLFILDTAYALIDRPIHVSKVILYPNAAGDAAVIQSYNPEAAVRATMDYKSVTVTLGTTITSTGNFETAEVAAGDIIHIYGSDSGNNKGNFIVSARSSDDAIVVGGSEWDTTPLTNEASKYYSWTTITPYTSLPLLCPATEKAVQIVDFGDGGFIFPNLILKSLSSSAKVYIYYK
jgi:hypothetical protein